MRPAGLTTDHDGYRYTPADPLSGGPPTCRRPSPPLGREAAAAGFAGFEPDACLLNRYEPGARMSLHQDRNERDFSAPIVSVSLGMPAVVFSAAWRARLPAARAPRSTATWSRGADRLRFHGVLPLKDRPHPRWAACA